MKKHGFDFLPDQKIIKAHDYSALIEANRMVEAALQESERILAEAREVYEQEKTRGYARGQEEGKGILAEKMLDAVRKSVEYFASAEETLCTLVINAVKKIVGEMNDRELVVGIVRNALALVRNQKQVTLRVSPSDHETVQNRVNEIMTGYPGIAFIDVVADARLKKSGCILESEMGIIDASLDVQVEAIQRSLQKSIKRSV